MKKMLVLGLFLAVSACQKNAPPRIIENLNGGQISVLGHGGMGIKSSFPINTFESISECLAAGADGSEMDVQMTRDGHFVLFHDADLAAQTDLEGLVNALDLAEIRAGRYDEKPFLSYRIAELEAVFEKIDRSRATFFAFDIKHYPAAADVIFEDQFIENFIAFVEKMGLENAALIEAQNESFLKKLHSKRPDWKLFLYARDFEKGLPTALDLGLFGLTMSSAEITKSQLKRAHDAGLRVAIWNVDSKSENQTAVEKSPDFIQTDRLRHLLDLLKKD